MAMVTGFEWRRVSVDGYPPVRCFNAGKNKVGKDIIMRYNDRCLIILPNHGIFISRYVTEVPKGKKPYWEGLGSKTKEPEYWIFLRDITFTDTEQPLTTNYKG